MSFSGAEGQLRPPTFFPGGKIRPGFCDFKGYEWQLAIIMKY